MEAKQNRNSMLKMIGTAAGVFFIIIVLPAGGWLYFESEYRGRIYPGAMIGGHDFGGLTESEAQEKLQGAVDRISREGVRFHYYDRSAALYPIIGSLEGDIAIEALSFDPDGTAAMLMRHGREGTRTRRLAAKVRSLYEKNYYNFRFAVNENELDKFFRENFGHFASPAEDAGLAYRQEEAGGRAFFVTEEKFGQTLDFGKAAAELKRKLGNLDLSVTVLSAAIDYPAIRRSNLLNIESEAAKIAGLAPLQLAYSWKSWEISQDVLSGWLVVKERFATTSADDFQVGLELAQVEKYLKEKIAPEIDIAPVEAKFSVQDGKVTEFQASRDGRELKLADSAAAIESALVSSRTSRVELAVGDKKSAITTENINDLGISELLGTGHSSFAGSPKNRRHNISVGAAAVNGTLVAPGEEFSLLKILGEINAETGYLPELVIKENRTIPEYGGGLCQIGTTAFRGTLSAGLPVTMRRNHSYRVGYYEPAGTDATIYDPWPDYRFKNDYPNHILITSRIEGDDLYFDFWGANDGREATSSYPVIYNIVRPAPTLIVETPDLKPGEKKCTEKPHNGADAYFDYTVKYSADNLPEDKKNDEKFIADGYAATTRFKSHYVPWREVCLVGIDPTKNASSTASQSESTN